MQGRMMHRPLRIIDILTHAAEVTADQGIVSARVEGGIHRQTYPETLAVAAGEARPTLDDKRSDMAVHFAEWQLPDDLLWVDDLPLTATGKVSKLTLRDRFADYIHPDLRGETA